MKTNVLCISARNRRNRFVEKLAMYSQKAARSGCTGLSGGALDSVRCARLDSSELATLGKLWRRTTIIHRTVRWCTGLSGEPTAASATVDRASRGRRVARANGRLGHQTVQCALDSVRCANQPGVATVSCARNGRKSRTRHEQWLSGGAPDCPVRHPT